MLAITTAKLLDQVNLIFYACVIHTLCEEPLENLQIGEGHSGSMCRSLEKVWRKLHTFLNIVVPTSLPTGILLAGCKLQPCCVCLVWHVQRVLNNRVYYRQ